MPPANAELVAIAWLKGVPGLPVEQIATNVPELSPEFATNGFVQVVAMGGTPDHVGMQRSVVEVSTYAYDQRKPDRKPHRKTADMWSLIKAALLRPARWVTLPAGYGQALVRDVRVVADPRRVDDAKYARRQGDIQIDWTQGGLYG